MSPHSEAEFERVADTTLRALLEALIDASDAIDPDLQSGVLTIAFDDGDKYVVNSHRAARQIWMAAEQAAWHFDYDPQTSQWRAPAHDGAELWVTVAAALSRRLGVAIELAPPARRGT